MFRNREGDEPKKVPKHEGDPKPEGAHFGEPLTRAREFQKIFSCSSVGAHKDI
jgi:hypothetical protein